MAVAQDRREGLLQPMSGGRFDNLLHLRGSHFRGIDAPTAGRDSLRSRFAKTLLVANQAVFATGIRRFRARRRLGAAVPKAALNDGRRIDELATCESALAGKRVHNSPSNGSSSLVRRLARNINSRTSAAQYRINCCRASWSLRVLHACHNSIANSPSASFRSSGRAIPILLEISFRPPENPWW